MKTVKIVVDVSMYPSIEVLKEPRVFDQISKQVYNILEKNRQKARDSAIIKACKNAVSLLLSKKKGVSPTFLSVYLPLNIIESSDDTVVPSVSSDEDLLETSVGEDDDSIHSDQLSSSNSQGSHISFSLCNNVMTANTTFEYLFDYFKHSLSINNKPMNLEKIVKDVCSYAFLELNCSVNIRMLKKEISRQISHIVQSARERAAGKSVIEILRTKNVFSLIFKSIDSLNRLEPSMGFIRYKNDDYLSPRLFIRENNDETAIFQFYPFSNIVEITINETLVRKALSSFDLVRALDTSEIFNLVSQCVATYDLKLNLPVFEEILKTKILFERSTLNSSYFLTMSVNVAEKEDQIDKVNEQSHIDDSHSFCEEEIDAIIGRTYNTRGVKRSFGFEDQGGHVNTYSWSLAPGLSEKIEETTKAIKNIAGGNLHRTTSSSSTRIDKDFINTVHGTVHFAKQLIRQHVLFRDAIVRHRNFSYPLSLFTFNEQLLNRKQSLVHYQTIIDGCSLPKSVSSNLYDNTEHGIAAIVQSYFKDPLIFFHSVKISNVLLKTTTISYSKLFADNCISFYFSDNQQKMGLIRAIVKSKQDTVRLLIEELIEKKSDSSKMKFKLNDKFIKVPNIFILNRSNIYHLKHPKWVIKKHAMIFRPGNCVIVLEYPNLKDNS
ncbi:unnamed protein product [Rotaria sp. Silwood1]|nr:unnamed protein product [Rotaria sp. Silwood1]